MDQRVIKDFQETVLSFYREHGRHDMAWRKTRDPYKILVSEVMLQQTQVSRVTEKYGEFLSAFPTVQDLAAASLADVLRVWQGLGYNRRGKFLKQAAEMIMRDFGGKFPKTQAELVKLPGVGEATAAAVLTYAYDMRVPFIETNVRTVYLHHFFPDEEDVSDIDLMKVVEKATPRKNLREWGWALMDYGVHLKQTIGNQNVRSKSYAKQSKFEGSRRQKRSSIIRELVQSGELSFEKLYEETSVVKPLLDELLRELIDEGMVVEKRRKYSLPS